MTRYRTEEGLILDTSRAAQSWREDTLWDGNNIISAATGSQWAHERLHKSRKGRYYVERWSDWDGSTPSAEVVTDREAAAWLLANGHSIPDDLKSVADAVIE